MTTPTITISLAYTDSTIDPLIFDTHNLHSLISSLDYARVTADFDNHTGCEPVIMCNGAAIQINEYTLAEAAKEGQSVAEFFKAVTERVS